MDHAVPNLPARDLEATLAFYGRLGFVAVYQDVDYAVLHRGSVELEFFAHPDLDPFSSSARCTVRIADLDGFCAVVLAADVPVATKGFPRLHPPRTESWGGRVAYLLDPDGTQLSLVQEVPEG